MNFSPSNHPVPGLFWLACAAAIAGVAGCDRARNGEAISAESVPDGIATAQPSEEPPEADLPIRIPFRLSDSNNILVEARINGGQELCLMFHTAASGITLSSESAEGPLGLRADDPVMVESWGGSTRTQAVQDLALEIGDCKWTGLTAPLDRLSGPGSAGKFGPNLFEGKVVEINFDHSELRIHTGLPHWIDDPDRNYGRIATKMEHGSLLVEGTLQAGGKTLKQWFLLHSGFGGSILLDDTFVREHGLGQVPGAATVQTLKDSFGNPVETREIRLESFTLGDWSGSDLSAGTFPGQLGGQATSVLGGSLLKQFNILIDLPNCQVYISPRSAAGTESNQPGTTTNRASPASDMAPRS